MLGCSVSPVGRALVKLLVSVCGKAMVAKSDKPFFLGSLIYIYKGFLQYQDTHFHQGQITTIMHKSKLWITMPVQCICDTPSGKQRKKVKANYELFLKTSHPCLLICTWKWHFA